MREYIHVNNIYNAHIWTCMYIKRIAGIEFYRKTFWETLKLSEVKAETNKTNAKL